MGETLSSRIALFWAPIKKMFQNGPNFHYRVNVVTKLRAGGSERKGKFNGPEMEIGTGSEIAKVWQPFIELSLSNKEV